MLHDYFQESWPEVSEGACRFMAQNRGLYPFAIGGNKLFFTKSRQWIGAYHDGLARMFAGQTRSAVMFGEPVLVIGPLTPRRRIARTSAWKAIRGRPIGRMLRRVGNWLR
jgi:hypothetical protein